MQDTIVLYPSSGIGHVISMVELGKLILRHYNHHFSITILLFTADLCHTSAITSYINAISQAYPSISFRRFPRVFVDTTPTRSNPAMAFEAILLNKPYVLDSLQEISKDGVCVPDAPTPPTYYIGPLIAGDSRHEAQHDCLSWLDRQPRNSVVFLCFGSRGSFSRQQLKEIANGLERSGQRFLWVVKNLPEDERSKTTEDMGDFDLESILPEGFLNRVKEKAMVVKSWAPQVAVLNHKSVGGFVTHCGWNSVLEAVVAGVPMVAWPLYAEQHLNRNILVEDMKMAIQVEQRDDDDGFVTGDELEVRVRELMESEKGKEMRQKSWMMRQRSLDSWLESGSSIRALGKLVEPWKKIC
ncbi:UDP-glycosyltransferase 88F4 isoform X3 [Ricinus communis]|uniref:UDP-glycosyltransferase 88F4 isoform X3 n=1 Tax=Ricinus communis TaxID=3988 RepID=UPI00201A239F|nr:UDP-glycosyltransferase 88F4 isoform X3 [Ricinus communis]